MQQYNTNTASRHCTKLHLSLEDIDTLNPQNFFSKVCAYHQHHTSVNSHSSIAPQWSIDSSTWNVGEFDLSDLEYMLQDTPKGRCKEYIDAVCSIGSNRESNILAMVESMCEQLALFMYQYATEPMTTDNTEPPTASLKLVRDAIEYLTRQMMESQQQVTQIDVSSSNDNNNMMDCEMMTTYYIRIEQLDFQAKFTDLEWEACRYYFAVVFPRICFPTYSCKLRFETLDELDGFFNRFKMAIEKLEGKNNEDRINTHHL
jgi:hypothetical protein